MRPSVIQLFVNLALASYVVAGPLQHNARQDPEPRPTGEIEAGISTVATTTQGTSQISSTTAAASSSRPSGQTSVSEIHSATTSKSSAISITQTPSPTTETNTAPSISPDNADSLPLEPRLTPGWGVAGCLFLISGLIYTVIGIKNQWLQTFLSTAYIGGTCTTILIVYLILPPVPDGIQGAYVVASVLAGLVLGGAATIFKELTEGFGCLLGGFCLGMWLLTLKAGGLLTKSSDKIIFLIAFSVVGFATSFSRHTRGYALIGFISFSGATVTVLGIDCFSRAGLKEFWAYIWNLNSNLFPSATTTYPLTKGITVETALIVIITIIGVISQLKLWRVIRERRAKKEEKQAEIDRQRDVEETAIGRQIEEETARERNQWEKTYALQSETPLSDSVSASRPVSQQMVESEIASQRKSTAGRSLASTDTIELAEMARVTDQQDTARKAAAGLMLPGDNNMSRITIRVARDVSPEGRTLYGQEAGAEILAHDEEATASRSGRASMTGFTKDEVVPAPEVVPLPFTIPGEVEHDDGIRSYENDDDDDDRSSFATFADDDERSMIASKRASRASLGTLGNRLSVGSQHLLRKLSVHSVASRVSKRDLDDGQKPEDLQTNYVAIENDLARREPTIPRLKNSKSLPSLQVVDSSSVTPENKSTTQREKTQAGEADEVPAPVDLTEDRLPVGLSRVALSYRTNEWAKHLSEAELPSLERLSLHAYADADHGGSARSEVVAPVDMASLQRTDGGIPRASVAQPVPSSSLNTYAQYQPAAETHANRNSSQIQERQDITPGVSPVVEQFPASGSLQSGRKSSRRTSRRHSATDKPPAIAEEEISAEEAAPFVAGNDDVVNIVSPARQGTPSHPISDAQIVERPPVPGVVSYSSPQTLLGQREALLRHKSTSMLMPYGSSQGAASGFPDQPSNQNIAYQPAQLPDLDDLTLTQRKQLIRQNSLAYQKPSPPLSAGEANFDSHQPQRASSVPSPAQREQALASFRQSVAAELRPPPGTRQLPQSHTSPGALRGHAVGGNFVSQLSLGIPGSGLTTPSSTPYDVDPTLSLERSRNVLMSQKEQESRRKEMEQYQKEQNDRAFEEMMRRGDMIDVHRDALRRMQSTARS
ncbi:hypothetical protein Micbo1qcDRAFT_232204 [Microdochium bolleyi]|uniref:TM7S3/TM198-like domain-containing protein n=1 Tax=Microdochium bolleyi TaxID=196109 RepID=A0A136JCB0_9PEZI|nr:hypothetical protein Micbo1qcDRAFT_232204 [Microdochium bolleyi]